MLLNLAKLDFCGSRILGVNFPYQCIYGFCLAKDVKDPSNYLNYITHMDDFMAELRKSYDVAYDLKEDIHKLQKKLKSANLRLNSISKHLNDSSSQNEDNDFLTPYTIVLEPMDLIFTIRHSELKDMVPNLVFEQKDSDGKVQTNYLYFNQSFKPFLIDL